MQTPYIVATGFQKQYLLSTRGILRRIMSGSEQFVNTHHLELLITQVFCSLFFFFKLSFWQMQHTVHRRALATSIFKQEIFREFT